MDFGGGTPVADANVNNNANINNENVNKHPNKSKNAKKNAKGKAGKKWDFIIVIYSLLSSIFLSLS